MKLISNRGSRQAGDQNTEPKKKLNSRKKALIITLSVLLAIVLAVALFLTFYVKPPDTTSPSISVLDPDTGEEVIRNGDDASLYKDSYYNILLAGTDKDGTRTDTIMIARLDSKNHDVALMSIPRDSIVKVNGRTTKINSVYGIYGCGEDGMEALMLKVEELLGFLPTGYALINLDAFVEMVDTIGGVYFDVPQRMYYVDPTQDLYIDLYPGYQLLDGEHAMELVRFRSYADADIQRTHVQQEFMKALVKQCLSGSNLTKISDYCDILSRNLTTSFSTGNLLFFAQELLKCNLSEIESVTLPGDPVLIDGSYYQLRDSEVKEIVRKSFNPYVER